MRTLFRHGAPRPLDERFWKKVNKNGPTVRPELGPCWLWVGSTGGVGYGRIGYEDKKLEATHVAVYVETGKWPVLSVCHKCDNVACVRYSHFFEGTHRENMEDMAKKGRGTGTLTNKQVLALRFAYSQGVTQKELSNKYKTPNGTVSRIVNNLRRKHIEEKK